LPTPPAFSNAQKAKRDFGVRLGEIRKTAGLTGRALASSCGWSESKVSRIENGKTAPSAEDLRLWAAQCEASDQTADLIASLEAIEGMFVQWRRMERGGLRRAHEAVMPVWQRTRRFRTYSPWLIPGAVQTESYTRALLRGTAARRGLPNDVEGAVQVRNERLKLLNQKDRTFAVLIEEAVLRNVMGDTDVMAGQLGYLLTVSELPSVSLGILPLGADRTAMPPVEDFWIFDDTQVNVELISGYLTITQPGEIAMYADAFTRLAEIAVVGAPARRLIATALEVLE
jgi:transcriptional regulator with XRE-family HTH domain